MKITTLFFQQLLSTCDIPDTVRSTRAIEVGTDNLVHQAS